HNWYGIRHEVSQNLVIDALVRAKASRSSNGRCEACVAAYADTCLLSPKIKNAPECDMWDMCDFGTGGGVLCWAFSFESFHQIIGDSDLVFSY
ncbi:unnamed protein product, partial [Prunus brigantina]